MGFEAFEKNVKPFKYGAGALAIALVFGLIALANPAVAVVLFIFSSTVIGLIYGIGKAIKYHDLYDEYRRAQKHIYKTMGLRSTYAMDVAKDELRKLRRKSPKFIAFLDKLAEETPDV